MYIYKQVYELHTPIYTEKLKLNLVCLAHIYPYCKRTGKDSPAT